VPAFSSVFIGAGLPRAPAVGAGLGAAGGGTGAAVGAAGLVIGAASLGVAGVGAGCGSDLGAVAGGFFFGVRFV